MRTMNKKLIVVLGMHRSGTSAITRGLQVLNVDLGERLIPAIEGNNSKGFWEDIDLNTLDNEILKSIGSDWCNVASITHDDIEALRRQGYHLRAAKLLRQKIGNASVIGLKDPRIAKLLPFWKEVFNHCQLDVSYVLAMRNPLSVVKSLEKRDGIEVEQSYLLWLGHVITSLFDSSDDNRILVDYDRLIQNPDHELKRIAKCIELEINPVALKSYKKDFLDQSLRHTVYELKDLSLDVTCPPVAKEIYTTLLDVASDKIKLNDVELQNKIVQWSEEFNRFRTPLLLVDKLLKKKAVDTKMVAERDEQITSLNQAVAEQKAQSASLKQAVADRDEQIANVNQALSKRDAQIVSLNQAVAEQELKNAKHNHSVAERDEQIANVNQTLTRRDAQIVSLNQALSEQKEQNTSLNQAVADRDEQIANVNQTLTKRDAQIVSLNQAVVEREKRITCLNREVIKVRRELSEILASKSCKITKPLRFARRIFISYPSSIARRAFSGTGHVLWRALPISTKSKQKLKGKIFKTLPWAFHWTNAYRAWNVYSQPLNRSSVIKPHGKQEKVAAREHVPLLDPSLMKQKSAKLICFYLPQFHPIQENDLWWGKGFTEWTNTAKARPLFPGHEIPNVPSDLGYYDLRVPESRQAQAELAREYGIEGFIYWHYWFGNGRRLLERPFNEVLDSGEPDFPFCLAWANHTWSGVWHGCPDKILIEQTYPGLEDIKAHFYSQLDAFLDPRYLKIDGRNVFAVYRPNDLQDAKLFIETWRELAEKEGAPGFYFIAIIDYPWQKPQDGYDAFTTNPPVGMLPYQGIKTINEKIESTLSPDTGDTALPQIYAYEDFIENAFPEVTRREDIFPCVVPNWDNTPRSGTNGFVMHGSTPELYGKHLREAVDLVADRDPDQQVIFVKSWNEWAETNYLEPDLRWGKAYLEKTREIIGDKGD